MRTVAFIHARGGSKRCPKKNIRWIAGKPLIAHTITQALNHSLIDAVWVSTDCEEIASVARGYQAEVLMRPEALCTDRAKEFKSWQYAVEKLHMRDYDCFVNLPCTAPLRSNDDIGKTIACVAFSGLDIAFTVKEVKNVLVYDESGDSVDKAHAVVGSCYAATAKFIRENESIFDKKSYIPIVVPEERSLDIDTEYDFLLAKLLMENA